MFIIISFKARIAKTSIEKACQYFVEVFQFAGVQKKKNHVLLELLSAFLFLV